MMIGHATIGWSISVLAVGLALTACSPRNPYTTPPDPPRGNSDDLIEADLTDYSTVAEAVQALRPRWLTRRTPLLLSPGSETGAAAAAPVWVYWDGTRMGDFSYLVRIKTNEVSRVIHYNARDASLRWGIDHENGAIYLVPAVGSVGPLFD
jgi:hypothetical protein